ncbi:N-alpha-acetyltransferase 50 [Blyttiomyces sp. JEL0837]|nr:N-alpha-acetyltransferase 50 [Blyttiomyces sp. JEL0837]
MLLKSWRLLQTDSPLGPSHETHLATTLSSTITTTAAAPSASAAMAPTAGGGGAFGTAVAYRTPKASQEVFLEPVSETNIPSLRSLNSVIFPIKYTEPFYRNVLGSKELSRLAFYQGECVGAICCRKEPISESHPLYRVYIMTLGVLAPYRRLRIGSLLVNAIIAACNEDLEIDHVCLHVQTTNTDAIRFYRKLGFRIHERVDGYYKLNKGVEPPDAFFLRRDLKRSGKPAVSATMNAITSSAVNQRHPQPMDIEHSASQNGYNNNNDNVSTNGNGYVDYRRNRIISPTESKETSPTRKIPTSSSSSSLASSTSSTSGTRNHMKTLSIGVSKPPIAAAFNSPVTTPTSPRSNRLQLNESSSSAPSTGRTYAQAAVGNSGGRMSSETSLSLDETGAPGTGTGGGNGLKDGNGSSSGALFGPLARAFMRQRDKAAS